MPRLMITVACPFDGCAVPVVFGPETIQASAPRPNPDNPSEALVELRPSAEAIREAARAHLAEHHPDITLPGDNDCGDVSPDAARWLPEVAMEHG